MASDSSWRAIGIKKISERTVSNLTILQMGPLLVISRQERQSI